MMLYISDSATHAKSTNFDSYFGKFCTILFRLTPVNVYTEYCSYHRRKVILRRGGGIINFMPNYFLRGLTLKYTHTHKPSFTCTCPHTHYFFILFWFLRVFQIKKFHYMTSVYDILVKNFTI